MKKDPPPLQLSEYQLSVLEQRTDKTLGYRSAIPIVKDWL